MTRSEASHILGVVVGAVAVLVVTGAAGLTMVVLAVGGTLLVRAELRRRPRATVSDDADRPGTDHPHGATSSPATMAPPAAEQPVTTLTEDELCWAWRTSYAQLQGSPDHTSRVAIADRRNAYLDEIARRDPSAGRR